MEGKLPLPSNVTRISQAIKPLSDDGIEQITCYQPGIGSRGSLMSRIIGGVAADGISENIRSGYAFLANNYAPGDELFFFGFSRGAFTVRTIAGMINAIGLLTKSGLRYLAEVFEDWINARNPNYRPRYSNVPFRDKPSALDPRYGLTMERLRYTRLGVLITVIGVWETVGALGVPRPPLLEYLPFYEPPDKKFLFYDTKLNNHILNAFQALALDEHRKAFTPAIWEKPRGNNTNLRQVWFPGAHSNVGGGYPDQEIANITLAWMMSQVRPFLDFYANTILRCEDENVAFYRHKGSRIRPWSFGKIYRSFTGIYVLGGRRTRHPGQYCVIDNGHVVETNRPLRKTMEYVHPCVRCRKLRHGPGIDDIGIYDASALHRYTVERPRPGHTYGFWKPRRHNLKPLYESPLWSFELDLLGCDEQMADYMLETEEPGKIKKSRPLYSDA